LLGASPEYGNSDGSRDGIPDKKQLLIVTLLDHLVSGQMVSSPTLFQRLCNRLKGMGVLDGCGFMDSMDKVCSTVTDSCFCASGIFVSRARARHGCCISGVSHTNMQHAYIHGRAPSCCVFLGVF
jgi:hypothetical protein